MKKLTLLLSLCVVSAFGQNSISLTDFVALNLAEDNFANKTNNKIAPSRNTSSTTTLFDDINDFLDNCTNNSSLIFEDFEGGPSANITQCGSSISASGDSCYEAGEIQGGVEFVSNRFDEGAPMVHFNGESFGVFDPSVGPDVFPDFLVINFSDELNVTSVAFDLYSALGDGAMTDVRLIGESGVIDSFIFDAPQDDFVFVGLVASERIISVEIENLDGVIENVAQFYFGNCEGNLSVEENLLSGTTFFPNPAQETITVTALKEIKTITIFSLMGQKVASKAVKGNSFEVNVADLSSGVYLMKVLSTAGSQTLKIVVE